MNPKIRNLLAIIVGLIAGSALNMGLVMAGAEIIPPPAGVDVTNVESLEASMHLFEFKHFVAPFLAHALGTLVGAYVAVIIAASYKRTLALMIGVFFLLGGITMAFMLPSPAWFVVVDLVGAYIPMAWIGARLTGRV
jgi:hypothetical protein